MYLYQCMTMNLLRGLHRSFFVVRSNRLTVVLNSCNKIFTTQDCAASSMPSVMDSSHRTVSCTKAVTSPKVQKISKAMKAYLERAKNHADFIAEKNAEFEIGKHHLANMMGVDVESLDQEGIDKAIRYLMPSGLYEKKARPVMKYPKELYPEEKAAQFEASGRPYHCFFYTGKSNFYQTMHETVNKFNELDAFEDKMLRRGIKGPPEESVMSLGGSNWVTIDEAKQIFLENITEIDYIRLTDTLGRLSAHPYSFRCKDFIYRFRKVFPEVSQLENIPELIQDETTGRLYISAKSKRKTTVHAEVTVWGNGEGKVKVNDEDICFFYSIQDREQIMFPLQFTGLLGQVDIDATVTGEGRAHSSQAGAIRHALSLCLRSFVHPEEVERMRLAGLLTWDKRRRERKKPGQKGARAKFKWRKR